MEHNPSPEPAPQSPQTAVEPQPVQQLDEMEQETGAEGSLQDSPVEDVSTKEPEPTTPEEMEEKFEQPPTPEEEFKRPPTPEQPQTIVTLVGQESLLTILLTSCCMCSATGIADASLFETQVSFTCVVWLQKGSKWVQNLERNHHQLLPVTLCP